MKKLTACAAAVSLMFSVVPMASAKGIFITPGTRANALGAAYVAIADDPTAIYWNPAGLAQLKGRGVELSMMTVAGKVTSNSSLGNVPVPNQSDGDFPLNKIYDATATGGLTPTSEPSLYASRKFETSATVPFMAGYAAYRGYTFALGYYGIAGGGGVWKDTVSDIAGFGDSITAKVDAQYFMTVANMSVARRIDPRWSVGAGIDLVSMTDKAKVSKVYETGPASPLGSYALANEKSATGTGLQFNAGVQFSPADQWRTGFVYRTGTTIGLSGKNTFSASGLSAFGLADFESAYDQKYTYPTTYALGAAYDPVPQWTLAAAVQQNNYGASKYDITYANQNAGLGMANASVFQDYKDTTQVCLGAEYRHTDAWAFRLGMYNDPVQVPTSDLTLLNIDQFNILYVVLGAGYTVGAFAFDAGVCRGLSDKPSKGGREYEYSLDVLRLAAKYAF